LIPQPYTGENGIISCWKKEGRKRGKHIERSKLSIAPQRGKHRGLSGKREGGKKGKNLVQVLTFKRGRATPVKGKNTDRGGEMI